MTRNVIIFIYIKNDQLLNTFSYKQHVDINIIININIKTKIIIFILNNKELNIKQKILNIKQKGRRDIDTHSNESTCKVEFLAFSTWRNFGK